MNFNFSGLALGAAQGLVDHDLGVGQAETLALGASGQQKGTHAGGHANAQGGDLGLDEVHGVKNRHARAHRTARGVDVERNVFVGVFAFQEQQLRDHQIGGLVIDATDQKNHPLAQQARVDVVRALATA